MSTTVIKLVTINEGTASLKAPVPAGARLLTLRPCARTPRIAGSNKPGATPGATLSMALHLIELMDKYSSLRSAARHLLGADGLSAFDIRQRNAESGQASSDGDDSSGGNNEQTPSYTEEQVTVRMMSADIIRAIMQLITVRPVDAPLPADMVPVVSDRFMATCVSQVASNPDLFAELMQKCIAYSVQDPRTGEESPYVMSYPYYCSMQQGKFYGKSAANAILLLERDGVAAVYSIVGIEEGEPLVLAPSMQEAASNATEQMLVALTRDVWAMNHAIANKVVAQESLRIIEHVEVPDAMALQKLVTGDATEGLMHKVKVINDVVSRVFRLSQTIYGNVETTDAEVTRLGHSIDIVVNSLLAALRCRPRFKGSVMEEPILAASVFEDVRVQSKYCDESDSVSELMRIYAMLAIAPLLESVPEQGDCGMPSLVRSASVAGGEMLASLTSRQTQEVIESYTRTSEGVQELLAQIDNEAKDFMAEHDVPMMRVSEFFTAAESEDPPPPRPLVVPQAE